jgi:molybdenum cofactor guanylyltransferase
VTGFDAIVLAGGASQRMSGVPKTALTVGGVPLLARVTAALGAARTVVVVGESVPAARADIVCREEPPGGGPVAGLAAGLLHVRAARVVVAAGDLPFLTAPAVDVLLDALGRADRAVAVDDAGTEQPLLSAWHTAALYGALCRLPSVSGAAMRAVTTDRTIPVALPGVPPPWWDCDDPAGLARARAAADGPVNGPRKKELADG